MSFEKTLVAASDIMVRKACEEALRRRRFRVRTVDSLGEAERLAARSDFDLIFLDLSLPDGPCTDFLERLRRAGTRSLVVVLTTAAEVSQALRCVSEGAFDYLVKPFALDEVELLARKAEAHRRRTRLEDWVRQQNLPAEQMLGESAAVRALRAQVVGIAQTDAALLIRGEPGTGKSLFARLVWRASARAHEACVAFDCAPADVEQRLFGGPRVAGAIELAHGATLVLENLDRLPAELQSRLLKILQDGRIEREGASRLDLRIIATARAESGRNELRSDLLHRIAVFAVTMPPLRERSEDIVLLAESFLARFSPGASFDPAALRALARNEWPGNLRELELTIERACLTGNGQEPIGAQALGMASAGAIAPIEQVEKEHIFRALVQTGGNRTHAARLLQISIRTLRNKLNEYKLAAASPQTA